ncbi:Stp1/IreP family PP2C-type Ser/Thr phosphatase [Anaerovorax odorimutans]|uniref:Stp1/IreP family PP2C-type Ser/Thr phosphatase n=1 Tax=Anaerovorax odorimutans TaxID=109327 RepID=A0ABT1RJE3_9FIRM|nr:Stp1/IreP family PP2C-type Ser/Thr phosphatase [Anaerovorax odorimutans]MCQ4635298.1 Stp1/IreP family PP2C-type Ser/Thr phosphatase [Anaerovorax odorimutans]
MAQIGFKSNTGVIRDNNEDACFVIPSHNVYVVADGVGGNNAGEIASRTCVRGVAEYVAANPIEKCMEDQEIYEYFNRCLRLVNDEIYQMGRKHKENKGMATTAVIAYIRDDTAYVVNVGDSRAYLYRGGRLSQITEDHTYVNELLRNGVITTEEAENHNQKNVITRAVGAELTVKADFFQTQLEKGDIVMLCSDGLYGEVEEQKLVEILDKKNTMSGTCTRLVEEAIRCGGRDNITVVCLKI